MTVSKCIHCGCNLIPLRKGLLYHPDVICPEGYGKLLNLNVEVLDYDLYDKFKKEHESSSDFDMIVAELDGFKHPKKKSMWDYFAGLLDKKVKQ